MTHAGVREGICLNGCTTAEIIAVSDARETMPQKSTYFYPKVPTGLVLFLSGYEKAALVAFLHAMADDGRAYDRRQSHR